MTNSHPRSPRPRVCTASFSRRVLRAGRQLTGIALGAYGVVTTLWFALKLFKVKWTPVEMVGSLFPLLLLPALLIAPVSLWRRRRVLLLLSLPAALTFIVDYGEFFVPHPVQAESQRVKFRFLTYNIHAESVHLQGMMEVIRVADADVVALQELSPAMAEVLAAQLKEQYPYQALHPNFDNPIWGQGVLSRYPIVEDEYWRISLGHQRVKLEIDGSPLVLYNTHPSHPFRLREGQLFDVQPHRREVDEVLRRAADDTGALIIAGDFNMTDQVDDYSRLAQRFHDAYREVGWGLGLTFPDFSAASAQPVDMPVLTIIGRPVARLDFIFHSEAVQALAVRVWSTSGGSDHRPVLAEFAVR